jgi:AcrR family transcriptional regulator
LHGTTVTSVDPAATDAAANTAAGAAATDPVLDAAAGCYLRIGVAKTTAAEIARAAGISRATLYRRYPGHEAIFLAVLTRESEEMAADAATHLAGIHDPSQRVLEGMMFAIGEIRRRPVHAAAFGGDGVAWAASRAIGEGALRRIAVAGVRPLVAPAVGHEILSEEALADLVDWILRVLISYAAVPGDGGRTAADIRRQLATWFLPAFGRLVPALDDPGQPSDGPDPAWTAPLPQE